MKKLTVLRNAVTSNFGRQLLIAQKHSPTLLFGAGVIGVVSAAVLASRATLKLDEVLEDTQRSRAKVEAVVHPEYSDTDRQRDLALIYVKGAVNVAKLYAPAVLVGVASVAALTGSHVVLNRRLAGVTAAYAALEKGFDAYRQRVIDTYGREEDRKFRYGEAIDTELAEDLEVGGTKIQKVKVLGDKKVSIYARFFDETSSSWDRTAHYNQFFIQCQQNYANDLLKSRGHVFLNEVYDMLGLARSPEGAVVGWLKDSKSGDGFIDFGVFDGNTYMGQEFVNGSERSVLLDFNVDGVIWDKI